MLMLKSPQINNLDSKQRAGPDKNFADYFAYPLIIIFIHSLRTYQFPNNWKNYSTYHIRKNTLQILIIFREKCNYY